MAIEYADKQSDTQLMLKALLQTLLIQLARLHRLQASSPASRSTIERMLTYIDDHSDTVTLGGLAHQFGYHPNYVSGLIHKETGRTFSQILLEKRMRRAALLIQSSMLPLEEIAHMLGYPNHSNFYKAFKSCYGTTPRAYQAGQIRCRVSDFVSALPQS